MKIVNLLITFCLLYLCCLPAVSKCKSAYKYNKIGFEYQKKAMYNEAIENYKTAISIDADYFPACSNLGTVYYLLGDYNTAIKYFDKAVMMNAESYAAHYSLGMALLNQYDKENEFVLQPLSTNNHSVIKLKLSSNSLIEQAISELKTAIQSNGSSYQARTALGIAYLKLNMSDKAMFHLNKALEINANYPIANYYMGLLLKMNSNPLCVEYFKKAVNVDPNYLKAYIELGKALAHKRQCQEALHYAESGLKMSKNNHDYTEIKDNLITLGAIKSDSKVSYKKTNLINGTKLYSTYQTSVDETDQQKLTELFASLINL